jgi:hypothetical protein
MLHINPSTVQGIGPLHGCDGNGTSPDRRSYPNVGYCRVREKDTAVTFAQDDKVTVIANPQCHGTVLESGETETNVKLDNLNVAVLFFNSELRKDNVQD